MTDIINDIIIPDEKASEINEIKDIENQIKDGIIIVEDEPVNFDKEKSVKTIKIPKKTQVITSIQKIASKLGIPIPSVREMNRTKLNILEKQLAKMTEQLTSKIMNNSLMPSDPKTDEEKEKEKEKDNYVSDEAAINSLYILNIMGASMIERICRTYRDDPNFKGYPIPNLEDYAKKLSENNELKIVLRDVVKEHGTVIKSFVSPLSMWLMLMIGVGVETANLKKESAAT